MPEPNTFQWTDAISWVLVICGWLLINRQNNSRETRKELRSKVDQLKKLVDEIEDAAVEHHTQNQTPIRCMKLKRALARMNRDLQLISSAGLLVDRYSQRVARMRQAVTLRNFDSSKYAPVVPGDPIVAEIGAASDDIRFAVEHSYVVAFNGKKRLL
jgi:hypothetical protein